MHVLSRPAPALRPLLEVAVELRHENLQNVRLLHTKTHVGMTTIFVILLHVWRLLPDLRLRELAGVFELVET